MNHTYILTVDVGTSSTKTVLWDEAGQVVAASSRPSELHRPDPPSAESAASRWWEAAQKTIREVVSQGSIDPHEVSGIGVDGVGWTLIAVDANVNPLHPAMIWLDRCAEEETDWLKSLDAASRLVNLCGSSSENKHYAA